MFAENAIFTETVGGLKISQDGTWNQQEYQSADQYLAEFAEYESSLTAFMRIMRGDFSIIRNGLNETAVSEDEPQFDETGTVPRKKVQCPKCKKWVDELGPNGYCSTACGLAARTQRAAASMSQSAEQTIEYIQQIRDVLKLIDMCLNLITKLPELIKGKAKLPEEIREYITLRIDTIFLKLKVVVNNLMIMKNDKIIQLLDKIKLGALDSKLQVIFAPISTIITTIISLQTALASAIAAIMPLLKMPLYGIPPQSYGWMMTAKSMQYAETAGKIFIEIVPKANLALPLPNMLSNINTSAILNMVRAAMPPIQDVEYFLDPTIFKVRYAVSHLNTPGIKKFIQMLESLIVLGADTFPRYSRLKLSNVWFVISILTGWGMLSRGVYGDFIFHGPI